MSPGSTSISASSTITAVTLKSAWRSTRGSVRSTATSTVSSRSSMASSTRTTSVRWSDSVGSTSSTYRFCSAGRRITCRPTPTVAALGCVVRGGTSTPRSRVADTRHASRHPSSSCSGENVRSSWRETGMSRPSDVTRILHLWQVPWPPQVIDRDAVPRRGVEDRDPRWHPYRPGTRRTRDREGQVDAPRAVGGVERLGRHRGGAGREALRGAGRRSRARSAAALAARCRAIQAMPHSSWFMIRSAALTASTISACGCP